MIILLVSTWQRPVEDFWTCLYLTSNSLSTFRVCAYFYTHARGFWFDIKLLPVLPFVQRFLKLRKVQCCSFASWVLQFIFLLKNVRKFKVKFILQGIVNGNVWATRDQIEECSIYYSYLIHAFFPIQIIKVCCLSTIQQDFFYCGRYMGDSLAKHFYLNFLFRYPSFENIYSCKKLYFYF